MLKTRQDTYHTGSMVRNAQLFGAAAVVLFPDPLSYIVSRNDVLANLPDEVSPSYSVKFVPGDPASPFVAEDESAMPRIPVVSLSFQDAKLLLFNYTDAFNVSDTYSFGLPLVEKVQRNFTASVEVNRQLEEK